VEFFNGNGVYMGTKGSNKRKESERVAKVEKLKEGYIPRHGRGGLGVVWEKLRGVDKDKPRRK
jgi:hypothetical protein